MTFTCTATAIWRETPETPKPDVSFIPPLERRRLTGVERAALDVAWQVRTDTPLPVVFASRWGEIGVTVKLMKQFHESGEMSPAGFSASVHNAAPGAFSVLTKNKAPYTAIAAGERSLESGLLEALALRPDVIFVYAEEATPDFYRPAFDTVQSGCAVAVRLSPKAPQTDRDWCFSTSFEHRARPPAPFDAFTDFLAGRSPAFLSSHVQLTRQTERS